MLLHGNACSWPAAVLLRLSRQPQLHLKRTLAMHTALGSLHKRPCKSPDYDTHRVLRPLHVLQASELTRDPVHTAGRSDGFAAGAAICAGREGAAEGGPEQALALADPLRHRRPGRLEGAPLGPNAEHCGLSGPHSPALDPRRVAIVSLGRGVPGRLHSLGLHVTVAVG